MVQTPRNPLCAVKSGRPDADHESVGDLPNTRASVSELSLLRPAELLPEPAASSPGGAGQTATLAQPIGDGRPVRLIGDVVVDLGFATREKVEEAVEIARAQRKPTGQVLVEQGVLRHDQLARVVAERFGLDYIDLSVYELDMGAVNLIDMEAIRRYQAVPVGFLEDGTLLLAMADPTNVLTVDDVAMLTGRRVRSASASIEDLNILIMRLSRVEQSVEEIVEEEDSQDEAELHMDEADKDAPVIKLVHSIIAEAIEQGASDIHIDPGEGDMHVLLRIDGVLSQTATLKRSMATNIISRVKIMSEMDISERRIPQDGRFALTVSGRRVDVRVTTLPLVYGEGAYLRILDKGVAVRGLESLGMQRTDQDRFAYAIARPNGAVLVTGPTGSGKSTTLYAALGAVNDGSRSILTIEDPVESRIAGVKQMQVAPKAGMTFAGGLRAMLRADPDVIMVGEIRDRETAHIAVEAALTGHLVLSTLHTRDAPSALGRLIDMGIEPFLISSAIDCVVAQRLVRVLCPHCKQPSKAPESLLAEYGLYESEAFEPVGCTRCAATGYRGRMGIYEVMSVSEEIRALVLKRASVDEIAAAAMGQGMRRMREDGIARVRAGQTSIAEIERMTTSML
jgi:type IV pilus assembly protein PilB